jgi:prevent-host-death family protein
MKPVNMHDAKTRLSALVEAVESGAEAEVVIARNGRPVARLVPMSSERPRRTGGLAKGRYRIPDDIDRDNDEIRRLFEEGSGEFA